MVMGIQIDDFVFMPPLLRTGCFRMEALRRLGRPALAVWLVR